MSGFVYLASPYTPMAVESDLMQATIREERFQAAAKAAAQLMAEGNVVFCPIAHSHPIDLYFDGPESGDFWAKQDRPFLDGCSRLVVLTLPGWTMSRGVEHEIRIAESRGIPVTYMDPV